MTDEKAVTIKILTVTAEPFKTDSVEFGGRAVLALATDPHVMEKTGNIFRVRDLAEEYGFEDV
jgi:hypothetical protein